MSREPVFIFGMTARTGTNLLQRLLCLHPDCSRFPFHEDFSFFHSEPLLRYSGRMLEEYQGWAKAWDLTPEACDQIGQALDHSLGDGILSFIARVAGESPARPVVKTPTIWGLRAFLRLCPGQRCVLLVRDGRSVTESLMRSGFEGQRGKDLAYCADAWVWAARELAALRASPEFERVCVVRFEELVTRQAAELERVLAFFGLSRDTYPMETALVLPVTGSSFLGRQEDRWSPTPKPADFDPRIRFESWDHERHAEFNRVAADGMQALGYELQN